MMVSYKKLVFTKNDAVGSMAGVAFLNDLLTNNTTDTDKNRYQGTYKTIGFSLESSSSKECALKR